MMNVGRLLARFIAKFHHFVEFPEDLNRFVLIPCISCLIIFPLNDGADGFTFGFVNICLFLIVWISCRPRSFTSFLRSSLFKLVYIFPTQDVLDDSSLKFKLIRKKENSVTFL